VELKPGYKQTEVGVIPEEWKSSTVRGLASSARNAIVGGPFGSDLVSHDYVEHGVPVIRGQNMSGQWVSGTFVFVTSAKAKSLEANLARPGDIVFTQRGTLGQVSLVPGKPFESYLVSQSQMKLSVNREVADPLFFFYVFTSEKQQELISGGTIQTGVPHINLGILRDIPVQLPPLTEQRAIAGALSDVDELIGALDQLIAKKLDLKQAAMQQLLTGQKRLPGFHGEWEVKRLGEIADVKTGPFGSSLHESDYVRDGTPIITVEHLGEFGVTHFNLPLVSDSDRHRLRAYSLEIGDIVFSRVGSVDRNALISPGEEGWLFSGRLLRVRTDRKKAFAPFLSYQFHGEAFKGLVRNVAVGQTMACLNTQILKGIAVVLPSLPEQTAIAEVLSDMDAELAALEQRRDKTRALKQGMMQELLTGKTRLVDSGKLRVESGERRTS
jgi:type I restriction enzyme S subunit